MQGLKRLLPTRESLDNNRWLKWLGPRLHHPRLWHMSRKGIAMGMALGVFFGLLVPIAQIPLSATMAVLLRANLPAAVASTLVTNPVTFGPVYYGAYKLGQVILLQDDPPPAKLASLLPGSPDAPKDDSQGIVERISNLWVKMGDVGKPLIVGLAVLACVTGFTVYFLAQGAWVLKVRWSRQRRLRKMKTAG